MPRGIQAKDRKLSHTITTVDTSGAKIVPPRPADCGFSGLQPAHLSVTLIWVIGNTLPLSSDTNFAMPSRHICVRQIENLISAQDLEPSMKRALHPGGAQTAHLGVFPDVPQGAAPPLVLVRLAQLDRRAFFHSAALVEPQPHGAILTHALNVRAPPRPRAFRDLGSSPHLLVAAGSEFTFGTEMTTGAVFWRPMKVL
ncbi:hypothetical protein B0H11DRAFT_1913562 [Mycena galericulata]|nr:hypothetical protein B0H11DRAFT_1913562 [Mycena galericulata]